MKALRYLKARLRERTTWAGIGLAVSGASMLAEPWSYVAVLVGIIGVLVPEPGAPE